MYIEANHVEHCSCAMDPMPDGGVDARPAPGVSWIFPCLVEADEDSSVEVRQRYAWWVDSVVIADGEGAIIKMQALIITIGNDRHMNARIMI